MAATSTIGDDFRDGVLDQAIWANSYGGAFDTGGRARVPCAAAAFAAYNTPGIYTFDTFGPYAVFPAASNGATTECYASMLVHSVAQPAGTDVIMYCDRISGNLRMANRVGFSDGTETDIVYSAVTHAWWRMRISTGNLLWETAPDSSGAPGSFTTRKTIATPTWLAAATDCYLLMESHRTGGTDNFSEYATVANPKYTAARTKGINSLLMGS